MNSESPNTEIGNGIPADINAGTGTPQDVWESPTTGDAAPPQDSPDPQPDAQPAVEPIAPAPEATVTSEISEASPESTEGEATGEATAIAPEAASEPPAAPAPAPLPESLEELMALDIQRLQQERDRLQQELNEIQGSMVELVQSGTAELKERRSRLRASIDKLEMRREGLRNEMRQTFAGASQSIVSRVEGFKNYLVGSLQDLTAAAEDLELVKPAPAPAPQPAAPTRQESQGPVNPQFARGRFEDDLQRVEKILDRYQMRPDYYGPPWRLRRTFERIQQDRVMNWFAEQGGRGAIQSLGSRLQNILVVSATISVLRALYGDRLRVLVLIDSPERLGEWRRGLQDCLGISRGDFGPERGVTLFDSADALAQKADRTRRSGDLPFIIIDESEGMVSLSLLQFPLWLAIAPDPRAPVYDYF